LMTVTDVVTATVMKAVMTTMSESTMTAMSGYALTYTQTNLRPTTCRAVCRVMCRAVCRAACQAICAAVNQTTTRAMCEAACRPAFSATSGDPMRLKSVEIRGRPEAVSRQPSRPRASPCLQPPFVGCDDGGGALGKAMSAER
jgi:hypothetical protein